MIPEVSVEELAAKLKTADQFILLDVREAWELALAKITDTRLAAGPMSGLANKGLDGLPEPALQKDAEIYVLCHHGVRSANVTGWLAAQGWTKVFSVAGGIDEYARRIDRTVGMY